MIEKLTATQQKKVPVYLNKWLKAGLRTKTTNKKDAKKAINFLYEKILKTEKPKYVIFLDSPMACQLAANLLKGTKFDSSQLDSQLRSQLDSQLDSQLRSQLYSQLDSQLYSQLDSQLYSQLSSQLDSQLDSQLRSQLYSQLRSQLYSQLRSQLDSQLRSQLDSQLRSQLSSQLSSQKLEYFSWNVNLLYWPGWTGFYDYVLNELFPKKKKEFKLFNELTTQWSNVHYYLLFPQIAFVSDYPKAIRRNELNMLHDYDKPALEYRDSYALYYSNGVQMKKELIETPANKITKEMFLSETNVDSRREISRKIGIQKTVEMLGAEVVDTYKSKVGGKYELLLIDFDNRGNKRPYLKMKSRAIDAYHIEGCSPEVKTVKEAICFRNKLKKFIEPEIIT